MREYPYLAQRFFSALATVGQMGAHGRTCGLCVLSLNRTINRVVLLMDDAQIGFLGFGELFLPQAASVESSNRPRPRPKKQSGGFASRVLLRGETESLAQR